MPMAHDLLSQSPWDPLIRRPSKRRVRRKLAITAYPRTEWMVPRKQLELDWSRIAAD